MERVERRRELDQALHAVDELRRVGLLLHLAVDGEFERQRIGIGDLVGGDEPGTERRIAVGRLAEAAIRAAAHGHVEAEAIAGDVVERVVQRNVRALLADHDDELGLVIVAQLGETGSRFPSLGPTSAELAFRNRPSSPILAVCLEPRATRAAAISSMCFW